MSSTKLNSLTVVPGIPGKGSLTGKFPSAPPPVIQSITPGTVKVLPCVAALKSADGPDLQIIGSGALIQTLQAASLIDAYTLWTFPVVLGRGKRLFEAGAKTGALRLVATRSSATGVVMSTYVPAGEIPPGSFAQGEPSAKELERRRKLAREAD